MEAEVQKQCRKSAETGRCVSLARGIAGVERRLTASGGPRITLLCLCVCSLLWASFEVLGPLMKSERFNNEIQSVIKSSNEAYAGQARDRLRRCLHSFWTPLVWMCN